MCVLIIGEAGIQCIPQQTGWERPRSVEEGVRTNLDGWREAL